MTIDDVLCISTYMVVNWRRGVGIFIGQSDHVHVCREVMVVSSLRLRP